MIICPACKTELPDGSVNCSFCGKAFYVGVNPELIPGFKKTEPEKPLDPQIMTVSPSRPVKAPVTGRGYIINLPPVEEDAPVNTLCPVCGLELKPGDAICPGCGAQISAL